MSNSIEQFLSLVNSDGKHGFYQLFPPALINKYQQLKDLPYESVRLDDKRYDYFTSKLNFEGAKVVDIGANIGYFSFRLATEKDSSVTMFEPYGDHCRAIDQIKELLELDQQVSVLNKGITLDTIDEMPETDILLFFNVLQHAGEDYDKIHVAKVQDWYAYAVEYLKRVRSKTKHMVFQNGYSWLGHKEPLCDPKDILPFTKKLLEDAGWVIEHCGMVTNFSQPQYQDVDYELTTSPLSSKLKYFEYGIRYRLGMEVPNLTFIQRPIYICKS